MYCNASNSCRVQSTICISENFFPDCVYSTILLSRSPPYSTTYLTATTYNPVPYDCSLLQSELKHAPPHHHPVSMAFCQVKTEISSVFLLYLFWIRTLGTNGTGFYLPDVVLVIHPTVSMRQSTWGSQSTNPNDGGGKS